MIHEMRLNNEPFNKIKEGTKTVELRLLDEKRKTLRVGDKIIFTNINITHRSPYQDQAAKGGTV